MSQQVIVAVVVSELPQGVQTHGHTVAVGDAGVLQFLLAAEGIAEEKHPRGNVASVAAGVSWEGHRFDVTPATVSSPSVTMISTGEGRMEKRGIASSVIGSAPANRQRVPHTGWRKITES